MSAQQRRPRPSSLRLIGGQWRGRRLPVADAPGLRPTGDRLRETLFNWLAPVIVGARCVDLFAGSGALGLEALSRGAAEVDFVEADRRVADSIRAAIEQLSAGEHAQVRVVDALAVDWRAHAPVDVVFIDPPFAADCHVAALAAVAPVLAPAGRAFVEYPARDADRITAGLADGFEILRARRAGRVGFCLLRPRRADTGPTSAGV